MKTSHKLRKKIFANHKSDKGFASRLYKDLLELKHKKTVLNEEMFLKHSPKEIYKQPRRTSKGCLIALVIKEMQIKTTMTHLPECLQLMGLWQICIMESYSAKR